MQSLFFSFQEIV